jgi:hypothetical protein
MAKNRLKFKAVFFANCKGCNLARSVWNNLALIGQFQAVLSFDSFDPLQCIQAIKPAF